MRSEISSAAPKAAEVGSSSSQPREKHSSGIQALFILPKPAFLAVFFAMCLLSLLPLAGCGPKKPVAADQPVPVRVRVPNRIQQPDSPRRAPFRLRAEWPGCLLRKARR